MTLEEFKARRVELIRRIRGGDCGPYRELLELRIEELRNQLERADGDAFGKVQGRIEECRNLLKML